MDFIRTTDHIQSRPGSVDHNTAPRDSSKPITNLSEFKGSARPRGRANAAHAAGQHDQHARTRPPSTDTRPPSLIARMTKGVLANQRRQLANLPSSSRDTRMARHYKASYILEDRGGATAPGAALSLRPTGKAAGGMDNPATFTKQELREILSDLRVEIKTAQEEYQRHRALAEGTTDARNRLIHENLANGHRATELECQRQYDAICWELEARSAGAGGASGGPRF